MYAILKGCNNFEDNINLSLLKSMYINYHYSSVGRYEIDIFAIVTVAQLFYKMYAFKPLKLMS